MSENKYLTFYEEIENIKTRLSDVRKLLQDNQVQNFRDQQKMRNLIREDCHYFQKERVHKHKKYRSHTNRHSNHQKQRPLYARAIPIEEHFYVDEKIEKKNENDDYSSDGEIKRPKTPLLFPIDDFSFSDPLSFSSDEYSSSSFETTPKIVMKKSHHQHKSLHHRKNHTNTHENHQKKHHIKIRYISDSDEEEKECEKSRHRKKSRYAPAKTPVLPMYHQEIEKENDLIKNQKNSLKKPTKSNHQKSSKSDKKTSKIGKKSTKCDKKSNMHNKNILSKELKITSKRPIMCVAVGDIEGDLKKLQAIVTFIKSNPKINFMFVGDFFDDLSDSNPKRASNWACLNLISEFFVDSEFQDISDFKEIKFTKANFDKIKSRVKFIAGNAECDALFDVCQDDVKKLDDGKIQFGDGKWKKTLSLKEMSLLYKYFKSCYGVIHLERGDKTLYFRHAPETFKRSPDMIVQIPEIKENEINNVIFVTGHIRQFVLGKSNNPQGTAFIIDTSPIKKDEVIDDKRMAVVTFTKETGFVVEAFSLPSEFPKPKEKEIIIDKQINNEADSSSY
ncbi:hypothetical protein TRFO_11939 [Tritrichomonas foetus]|uniref:Calcineurin-like phosphoesterase domain-containing protein n=1 Tax=Tritrichomonas foetus TaxID=1144522 RepID=A0A1J4J781_9EUKA|nr:hypothetical protein TRFO_11939 [Tritrichomonas foetus]|eukprot:OHS93309.1 hypothetical protein TRFO_11939 [Tritrichomonas foetus]